MDTRIDILLKNELLKIRNEEQIVNFVFSYCISQKDRKRLLNYIQNESNDRKDVLLMASQIGIESGTAEGELEEV